MIGSFGRVRISLALVFALLGAGATCAQNEDTVDPTEKTQEQILRERHLRSLKRNFEYRMENQQYHIAVDIALRLHDLEPEGGIAALNLARVFSQIGDIERSLEWLETAVEAGFSNVQILRGDRALVTVSTNPAFNEIIARADAIRLAQFEKIKEEFDAKPEPFRMFIPPNYDEEEPGPLIIALHGFGVDAVDIIDPWLNIAINRGAILVAPNGPRKSGDGFSWLYEDESEWIVQRTLDRTLERHAVDTSKIILTGFSQGAKVAYDVALANPHLFHGVIPIAGQFRTSIDPPTDLPEDAWPAFYFMVGEKDGLRMSSELASKALRDAGFDVEYVEFPEVGHTLPEDYDSYLFRSIDWILEH